MLAVVLSYLTALFQSRLSARLGHGLATALVPLTTFAVIVAIAFGVSNDASSQTARLASVLNEKVQDLAPNSLPGRNAKSTRLQQAIDEILSSTGTSIVAGKKSTTGLASPVVDLFIVIIVGSVPLGQWSHGCGPHDFDLATLSTSGVLGSVETC